MYYILVGIIVLGAFFAMYLAAWWYGVQTAETVDRLRELEAKQASESIYNCLNAVYDDGYVVFPGKTVWVKNPHLPECRDGAHDGRHHGGGRCGAGEGDRVKAQPGDVIVLPSACYVKVVETVIDGRRLVLPQAVVYG